MTRYDIMLGKKFKPPKHKIFNPDKLYEHGPFQGILYANALVCNETIFMRTKDLRSHPVGVILKQPDETGNVLVRIDPGHFNVAVDKDDIHIGYPA
jgi:hypothetical protein